MIETTKTLTLLQEPTAKADIMDTDTTAETLQTSISDALMQRYGIVSVTPTAERHKANDTMIGWVYPEVGQVFIDLQFATEESQRLQESVRNWQTQAKQQESRARQAEEQRDRLVEEVIELRKRLSTGRTVSGTMSERATGLQANIEQLKHLYSLRNPESVSSFLLHHKLASGILIGISQIIRSYFPDAPLALELVSEPDAPELSEPVIWIGTNYEPDIAIPKLAEMNSDDDLRALKQKLADICIVLEPV